MYIVNVHNTMHSVIRFGSPVLKTAAIVVKAGGIQVSLSQFNNQLEIKCSYLK